MGNGQWTKRASAKERKIKRDTFNPPSRVVEGGVRDVELKRTAFVKVDTVGSSSIKREESKRKGGAIRY